MEIVQRTYGYFVDKAQWTQLSKLFADDATLEIGGRGVFVGATTCWSTCTGAFGPDGIKEGQIINHMQFQPIADIDPDGLHAKQRMRAFVMRNGGWGIPLYENEYVQGERRLEDLQAARPLHHVHLVGRLGEVGHAQHPARELRRAAGPAADGGLSDLPLLLHRALPLPEPGDRQAVEARDPGGRRLRLAEPGLAGQSAEVKGQGRALVSYLPALPRWGR